MECYLYLCCLNGLFDFTTIFVWARSYGQFCVQIFGGFYVFCNLMLLCNNLYVTFFFV
jgi:hypothetical protein